MFRANEEHLQGELFGLESMLSETQRKALRNSRERYFYDIIFKRIQESDFAVLYSDGGSRPNAPVNCMVGASILQYVNSWSYEFLMRQVRFDLLTWISLGLSARLDEVPFCEATLFNF